MNLLDFAFFGFPSQFLGFSDLVRWITSSAFELIFLVMVLNFGFSILKSLVLYLGGVKK